MYILILNLARNKFSYVNFKYAYLMFEIRIQRIYHKRREFPNNHKILYNNHEKHTTEHPSKYPKI